MLRLSPSLDDLRPRRRRGVQDDVPSPPKRTLGCGVPSACTCSKKLSSWSVAVWKTAPPRHLRGMWRLPLRLLASRARRTRPPRRSNLPDQLLELLRTIFDAPPLQPQMVQRRSCGLVPLTTPPRRRRSRARRQRFLPCPKIPRARAAPRSRSTDLAPVAADSKRRPRSPSSPPICAIHAAAGDRQHPFA